MFIISFVSLSCRKEFEKINTNPYQPTDTMLNYNNLKVGVFFPQLAKAVITIGTPAEDTGPVNNYQIAIDLGVNNWAGYTAARSEKFNGGNNLTTYFF
ncbi:SusD/RagB family nutrient-binding outer membrane lipoprotein [Sphingobacterium spiritivorum]|nr:SusD/RagB family nutrient-binding outer membrane lipoprotein [Sphingobacterium spiritivorum]